MTGNYTDEMGAVKTDLKILKDDLTKLTEKVSADAKTNARELRDKAAGKIEEARTTTVKKGAKGRAKAEKAIKENPLVGIAATAGIGLLVGAFLARR
ncbi:DUF883 family protein [Parasphingorhabdus halotolerans]|uniref:DUF883 domain-containing protein n=1 Tax=Parasphingorhabdus halotolerans TaxID=2725558 RepID=A0A6H2DQQ2_9SPHN|nr:DUF883 family protein [Parasphingorhabdus halotolerans]QJB70285.1 DUF883 domain-containing protein [Parasphingorhabdus halotolerans]